MARRPFAFAFAFCVCAISAPFLAAVSADSLPRPQPLTVTQSTSNSGDAYAFLNTNAAGSGLVGQVGPSVYANSHAGLLGVYDAAGSTVGFGVFGLSTTGDGIYGRSTSASYAGVYGVAVGNAVVGVSSGSSGVFGQTSVANNVLDDQEFPADSTTYGGRGGVIGNDVSPVAKSNYVNENAGVVGITKYGLGGVVGILSTGGAGSVAGVVGANVAPRENGLYGYDATTTAGGSGLLASSGYGTGVTTFSTRGEALNAYSSSNIGLEADNATTNYVPALLVQGDVQTSNYPLVIVRNNFESSQPDDVFSIGGSGNVIAQGTITGSASPLAVTRATSGSRYVAYGTRASSPTIEDVGFGTVTNGYALVRLDATFASTIDSRAPYAVFVSAEGENDGIYVTAKTASSFVIREIHHGTSTFPFSYRIVARPADMPLAQRLPDVRTAVVQPIFDDRDERAMHLLRKAERARLSRAFPKTR